MMTRIFPEKSILVSTFIFLMASWVFPPWYGSGWHFLNDTDVKSLDWGRLIMVDLLIIFSGIGISNLIQSEIVRKSAIISTGTLGAAAIIWATCNFVILEKHQSEYREDIPQNNSPSPTKFDPDAYLRSKGVTP